MTVEASAENAAREALMFAYLEAWNSHDPGSVAEFFATTGVYDDRGAGVVAEGMPEIRAHVAAVMTAFPDLHFELLRSAHGEDFTAGEWKASMTHRGELDGLQPTGCRVSSEGVDVATLDDEVRISHLVSYYDGAAIMRELGLLPERGSRLERTMVRAASLLPRRP
jgi:predicted ester cyclase